MSIFDSILGGRQKTKRKRILKGDKDRILKRQRDSCAKCGTKFSARSVVHYDHKTPLALGGSDTTRNLQALCPNCHAKKTRKDRAKIAKSNRNTRSDPFGLGISPRRRRVKDPFDIKLDLDPFGTPKKRRKKKKKDPFDIF